MSSPLLALFVRSLREDSRVKLTYLARSGLVVIILLFLFTVQSSMGWANAPGLQFFGIVIAIDLCFVILAGVSYFAAAISEEKEEQTLGLLRMTNLNPLSILLGKSTSRLCAAILLFAAQIPFTLLAITLGGISLPQIFAAYLAVAAFLVLVSNLALLGSVIFRRTGTAGVFTGVALFFFFMIVPVAGWLALLPQRLGLLTSAAGWVLTLNAVGKFALDASPFAQLDDIFRTGFRESAFSFQVWSNLALGTVFFLLAWALFETFCREQKESAPSRTGAARAVGRRRAFSPGRPGRRALAWKDFYFGSYFCSGGKFWLAIKLLVYAVPLVIALLWPPQLGGRMTWQHFGHFMFWLMLAFMAVELAFVAASILRVERQGQTLSSLAMLPQGLRRVAYEKFLGALPSLGAAALYFVASLPLVWPSIRWVWHEFRSSNSEHHSTIIAGIIFAGAQYLFFLHLAANFSLRVKRGALPLAIGTHFLLAMLVGIGASSLRGGDEVIYPMFVFTLIAIGFLHVNTGHRLAALAAED